jgi:hypothetical protein
LATSAFAHQIPGDRMAIHTISQPYYRIWRPFLGEAFPGPEKTGYLVDPRYASNRVDLIRSYHYLQQDLEHLFEFVEPADDNRSCYSHRLYALLLRASTEFETNAKAILAANHYPGKSDDWNITDYNKLENALRLSEYKVKIPIWRGASGTIEPFSDWATPGTALGWYRDYNAVKHNRRQEFPLATLENVRKATSGVLAIVFSQFYTHALDPRGTVTMWEGGSSENSHTHPRCLFEITPPSWPDSDHYNFIWTKLSTTTAPFQQFTF